MRKISYRRTSLISVAENSPIVLNYSYFDNQIIIIILCQKKNNNHHHHSCLFFFHFITIMKLTHKAKQQKNKHFLEWVAKVLQIIFIFIIILNNYIAFYIRKIMFKNISLLTKIIFLI